MRFLLALAVALLFAGCGNDDEIFRANPDQPSDPDAKIINEEIADLAKGAKPDDPESSVAYDAALNKLILRGVKVETRIIDALRQESDASIRLGCVEILGAIATKAAIPHLIAVLDDVDPLVAWRSEIVLRTLSGTRFIPEAGQPPKNGLPPVPKRNEKDLGMDSEERLWATWHGQNKAELKAAWERWWADNKATFNLK